MKTNEINNGNEYLSGILDYISSDTMTTSYLILVFLVSLVLFVLIVEMSKVASIPDYEEYPEEEMEAVKNLLEKGK